jgi:hypothetical protein
MLVLTGEDEDDKRDNPRLTSGSPMAAIDLYVADHLMIVELVP